MAMEIKNKYNWNDWKHITLSIGAYAKSWVEIKVLKKGLETLVLTYYIINFIMLT